MNDQDVNLDASFCEKIKKGVPYHHPKAVGPKPKRGKFSPSRVPFNTPNVPFGTPKVLNQLLDTEHFFVFRCRLDFSSRLFLIGPCTQTCFHSLSMIFFISFLNNSIIFKTNYLVDKYPKINLDKVQIIHNFIFISSSLLFLCMRPYFKF